MSPVTLPAVHLSGASAHSSWALSSSVSLVRSRILPVCFSELGALYSPRQTGDVQGWIWFIQTTYYSLKLLEGLALWHSSLRCHL